MCSSIVDEPMLRCDMGMRFAVLYYTVRDYTMCPLVPGLFVCYARVYYTLCTRSVICGAVLHQEFSEGVG